MIAMQILSSILKISDTYIEARDKEFAVFILTNLVYVFYYLLVVY